MRSQASSFSSPRQRREPVNSHARGIVRASRARDGLGMPDASPRDPAWRGSCRSSASLAMSDSAESSKVAGMVVDTSRDGSPGASDRAPGCCALIVEDDESLRTLLAHYLRGEGFA